MSSQFRYAQDVHCRKDAGDILLPHPVMGNPGTQNHMHVVGASSPGPAGTISAPQEAARERLIELLKQTGEGSKSAFAELCTLTSPKLLRSSGEAEDVLQNWVCTQGTIPLYRWSMWCRCSPSWSRAMPRTKPSETGGIGALRAGDSGSLLGVDTVVPDTNTTSTCFTRESVLACFATTRHARRADVPWFAPLAALAWFLRGFTICAKHIVAETSAMPRNHPECPPVRHDRHYGGAFDARARDGRQGRRCHRRSVVMQRSAARDHGRYAAAIPKRSCAFNGCGGAGGGVACVRPRRRSPFT